ncbi:Uncharacterised protein [Vibrio cholerae]|nr:Uncharacterised protein [Vibrio cholerae]CSC27111.1 Uncharacterised protein [Vibrio cholerae]
MPAAITFFAIALASSSECIAAVPHWYSFSSGICSWLSTFNTSCIAASHACATCCSVGAPIKLM